MIEHGAFDFEDEDNIAYLPIDIEAARRLGISPYTERPLESYLDGLKEFLKTGEESPTFKDAQNGDPRAIDWVISNVKSMLAKVKKALLEGELFIAPSAPDEHPAQPAASMTGAPNSTYHSGREFIASVILRDVEVPSNDVLFAATQARLPDARPITMTGRVAKPNTRVFAAQGIICMFTAQNFALPISEAECRSQWNWLWPHAWDEVQHQRTHVVVSVAGEDARAASVVFGQLIAAIIEASNSPLAVCCPSSHGVWPAKSVIEMANAGENIPPFPLCVSVSVSKARGGFWRPQDKLSALTKGLDAFGLKEIESDGYGGQPMSLYTTVLDLAIYLIDNGPVLKDGDTIGPNASTKIKVRWEKLKLREGKPEVYRLYF